MRNLLIVLSFLGHEPHSDSYIIRNLMNCTADGTFRQALAPGRVCVSVGFRLAPVPTPLGVDFRGPNGRLGYLLRQAQHALWIALEAALAPLGITASQFGVLRLVDVQPGATGADLAQDSMYSPQSTHQMLMTLQAAGLVERRHDPNDRRLRRVHITAAGTDILAEAHRRAIAIEEDMMHGLNDHQRHDFKAWLVNAAANAAEPPTT
jgi:DNA-binding MarR family transcriptional regulator